MAISAILTQGIGSFGGVQYLPTLGFSIGDDAVPEGEPEITRHRTTVETATSHRVFSQTSTTHRVRT